MVYLAIVRNWLLVTAVLAGLIHLAGCKSVGTVCENSGSTSECGDELICTFTRSPGTFDPSAEPPPPLSVCLRTCNESSDCGEGELCRFVYCSALKSCQTGPVQQEPPLNLCGCEYEQDFESLDINSPTALGDDGWWFFGNVFDESGTPKFSYPNDPPAPDPAPNASADPNAFISAIVSGEDGTRRGAQQLVVSNDYSCCSLESTDPQGHGNGTDRVETIVFREINPIPPEFVGEVYEFRFDARRGNIAGAATAQAFIRTRSLDPMTGEIVTTDDVVLDTTDLPVDWATYSLSLDLSDREDLIGQRLQFGFSTIASNFEDAGNLYDNTSFCATALGGTGGTGGGGGAGGFGGAPGPLDCDSTATAYIQTLDPDAGFIRTNLESLDTTDLPDTWQRYSVTFAIDAGDTDLVGQILQFGFTATAQNDEPSGVFYDNIVVDPGAEYSQDFESLEPSNPTALTDDGWISFGNVFEEDGETFFRSYGPFGSPNGGPGFSGIDTGQGDAGQGANQLTIYSDYGNRVDQEAGRRVQASTFQERSITAADLGNTIVFSFDAKRGNINSVADGCAPPEGPANP